MLSKLFLLCLSLCSNISQKYFPGACELVENMESVILSAPLDLSEDYQLIDQSELDKQMEEDSSSLLAIDSIQNASGKYGVLKYKNKINLQYYLYSEYSNITYNNHSNIVDTVFIQGQFIKLTTFLSAAKN